MLKKIGEFAFGNQLELQHFYYFSKFIYFPENSMKILIRQNKHYPYGYIGGILTNNIYFKKINRKLNIHLLKVRSNHINLSCILFNMFF